MSKRPMKTDKGISAQQGLFDEGMGEGSMDLLLNVKQMMSRLISSSHKDRFDICTDISRATSRSITKEMLDKYTSSDLDYEIGAVKLAAFCRSVGSLEPFSLLVHPLGAEIITDADVRYLKLARLEEQRRMIDQELQIVRAQCGLK